MTRSALGFTLIEMIITVSIMVIVAGMSVAGIVVFNQNQGITDDSEQVLSELRRAYSRATGIFYPPTCTGKLTGYKMTFTNGSKDITVTAQCATNIAEIRINVLKSSTFSGTTTLTISAGDGRVSGSPYTITIRSVANTSLTKVIKVSDFGVFELL